MSWSKGPLWGKFELRHTVFKTQTHLMPQDRLPFPLPWAHISVGFFISLLTTTAPGHMMHVTSSVVTELVCLCVQQVQTKLEPAASCLCWVLQRHQISFLLLCSEKKNECLFFCFHWGDSTEDTCKEKELEFKRLASPWCCTQGAALMSSWVGLISTRGACQTVVERC